MMGARNDLQIQFLREADLGGVVAVEGDAFKDGEEIASKLLIAVLRDGVAVMPPTRACRGDGFVHGTEHNEWWARRSTDEIFPAPCHGRRRRHGTRSRAASRQHRPG